jgi:hypothetical protein
METVMISRTVAKTSNFNLPSRSEQLWLVVVAGFGDEPLMLLTDLPVLARDSQHFGGSCKSIGK